MMTVSTLEALGGRDEVCMLDQFRGAACDDGNPEVPQRASIVFNLLKPTGCVHQQV